MKKTNCLAKRFMAFMLMLACVITLLPQGTLVAEASTTIVTAPSAVTNGSKNNIWVDGSTYVNKKDADSNNLDLIKWEKTGTSNYILYLPSSVDLSKLTVWHTFSDTLYVDGTEVQNGEVTDVFKNAGNFELRSGSNTYYLKVMHSTNINTLFMTTTAGNLDKVNAKKGNKDSGDVVYVDAEGNAATVGLDEIKGRGNSSWEAASYFGKYPYNIKLAKKKALYGMKESKKWCLLANDFDQALLRNKFIFDIAEEAGMAFTPDHEFADVYENGRYIGNYLVTSKIEIAKNRIDIFDLEGATEDANKGVDLETLSRTYMRGSSANGNAADYGANTWKYVNIPNDPEDITAGYLLEFELYERYGSEASGFVTGRSQQVVCKSPEFASKNQVKYIRNYYQEMEDAVYASDGYNSKDKYYTDYVDLESAAEMYILEELSMEVDAVATSFYVYKNTDDKFYFGPAWDFDWSLGGYDHPNRQNLLDPTKLILDTKTIYSQGSWNKNLTLLGALTKHSEFMETVYKVWVEKFAPLLQVSVGQVEPYTDKVRSIQDYAGTIKGSAEMNFDQFPKTVNTNYWSSKKTGKNFTEAVNYLDNFVKKRVAYLNKQWATKSTLYFDNSVVNWSDAYAYVWNNTSDGKVFEGTKLDGTNVYEFNIRGSYANVIFKNTKSTWEKQTEDLSIVSGKNCFKATGSKYVNNRQKYYGEWYQYGQAVETTAPATAGPDISGNVAYFDNTNANWGSVYAYVWNTSSDATVFPTEKIANTNLYKVTVDGTYKNLIFKNTDGTTNWNLQTVNLLMPGTTGNNCYKPNHGGNKPSGSWYTYVEPTPIVTATPIVTSTPIVTTAPIVTATPEVTETPVVTSTPEVTATPVVTATPAVTTSPVVTATPNPSNSVTVYYSSSWSNTYIHYAVEGKSWTAIPGVAMTATTERAGYNCKYVIDLGEANSVQVCFNNGSGVWDSKNSQNYTLYAGEYGIKNGTETKLGDEEDNKLTVYYSTGWSQAYIHFKVDGGTWTTLPGMKMSVSDNSAYTYMYVIDLGAESGATICFNNGGSDWDSNGGKNYYVSGQKVAIRNGCVIPLN